MHQYLTTLTTQHIDKKDDIGVKIVKTALIALLNKYDDELVLTAYRNVYRDRGMPEEPNLSKWLKQLIKNKTRDQTFIAPADLRASNVPNKPSAAADKHPETATCRWKETRRDSPIAVGQEGEWSERSSSAA